jgi:hypothetical protein
VRAFVTCLCAALPAWCRVWVCGCVGVWVCACVLVCECVSVSANLLLPPFSAEDRVECVVQICVDWWALLSLVLRISSLKVCVLC